MTCPTPIVKVKGCCRSKLESNFFPGTKHLWKGNEKLSVSNQESQLPQSPNCGHVYGFPLKQATKSNPPFAIAAVRCYAAKWDDCTGADSILKVNLEFNNLDSPPALSRAMQQSFLKRGHWTGFWHTNNWSARKVKVTQKIHLSVKSNPQKNFVPKYLFLFVVAQWPVGGTQSCAQNTTALRDEKGWLTVSGQFLKHAATFKISFKHGPGWKSWTLTPSELMTMTMTFRETFTFT